MNKLYFYILLLFFTAIPCFSSASQLYISSQTDTLINTVSVDIYAEATINAVQGSIIIPPHVIVREISDGDSVVNYWIEKPHVNAENQTLVFSGIIPGGFNGKKGHLISISLSADTEATYPIEWNKEITKVYLHTPDAREDIISFINTNLNITTSGSTFAANDIELPEHFLASLEKNDALAKGKWFAVFSTQDKKSGIDHYEVAEKRGSKITDYKRLSWKIAENPYQLSDQGLKSYIYIKAVDYAHNERVEIMPPQYPITWYDYFLYNVLPILLVLIALVIIIRFLNRRRHEKN